MGLRSQLLAFPAILSTNLKQIEELRNLGDWKKNKA